jgi:hypothetical protein
MKMKKVYLETKLELIPPFANSKSFTNLSRSLSISIRSQSDLEMSLKTNEKSLIELIISRDPNLFIPSMILQNVLYHNQPFHYKYIDLNQLKPNENLTVSIHFQIQSENKSLSYFFIYQYDHPIQFDRLDGSLFFCPSSIFSVLFVKNFFFLIFPIDLTRDDRYLYYINNEQLSIHQSLIYVIRQLTVEDYENVCIKNSTKDFTIENENSNFT